MSTNRTGSPWIAMAAALAFSGSAMAVAPGEDARDAHHPDEAAVEAAPSAPPGTTPPMRMHAMQEHMQMMEQQMAGLETMMKGMADCPMMSGDMPAGRMGKGPMDSMGMGGMGMMRHQGGSMQQGGMMPHHAEMMRHHAGMMQQHTDMLNRRIDSIEKRLDLMQAIMQSQMERRGRMPQ